GLLSAPDFAKLDDIMNRRRELLGLIERTSLVPNPETQEKLRQLNTPVLNKPIKAGDLLRRDESTGLDLRAFGSPIDDDVDVTRLVEIHVKFSGYIKRQDEMIEEARRLENVILPKDISYKQIRGLSREEVEKLNDAQPRSLGQAQRISGVNPSAVQA